MRCPNTTGGSNTCAGDGAGNDLTTGEHNIVIGTRAGGYSQVLSTGVKNILIGRDAHTSAADGERQVVLGTYQAQSKGNGTFYVDTDQGVYHGGNTTTWSTTSDERIKKNISNNNVGLEKIKQIQVRNFEYKTEEEIINDSPELSSVSSAACVHKEGIQLGVIAQELEKVLPEFVGEESTGIKKVNADHLAWYLVNAIKELSAENTALEARLSALEAV